MTAAKPEIDFSKFDFPTDRLTLGALRRRFPAADRSFLSRLYEDLGTLLFVEEGFARLGFAGVAAGKKGQDEILDDMAPEGRRPEAEGFLVDRYIHYALADGPETAKQMIRRLEQMGAQHALDQLGRTGR